MFRIQAQPLSLQRELDTTSIAHASIAIA
jgi:hypothetical protein